MDPVLLIELQQKAQALRPTLDSKYRKSAPVPWDVNKKDRSRRFGEPFHYTFNDHTQANIECVLQVSPAVVLVETRPRGSGSEHRLYRLECCNRSFKIYRENWGNGRSTYRSFLDVIHLCCREL